jgi:hypothetical protein
MFSRESVFGLFSPALRLYSLTGGVDMIVSDVKSIFSFLVHQTVVDTYAIHFQM